MSSSLQSSQPAPRVDPPAVRRAKSAKGTRRVSIGQVFGRLTIVEDAGGSGAMSYRWKCRCDCGEETTTAEYGLLYNGIVSCGCIGVENRFNQRMADATERYVGKTYGFLTVTAVLPAEGTQRHFRFLAKCACGSKGFKTGTLNCLASGKVTACCRPRTFGPDGNILLMSVLRQLQDGISHYRDTNRLIAMLVELGAYDVATKSVTPYGAECLAAKRFIDHSAHRAPIKFTERQRHEAAARSFEDGQSISLVAREMGISTGLLHRWREAFKLTLVGGLTHALCERTKTVREKQPRPARSASALSVAHPRKIAVGEVHGRWTIESLEGGSGPTSYRVMCRCTCGRTRSLTEYAIVHGQSLSCGCQRLVSLQKANAAKTANQRKLDVGDKRGRWTVLATDGGTGSSSYRLTCRCDCGASKSILEHLLLSGGSTSCGCSGKRRRPEPTASNSQARGTTSQT